MAGTVRRKRKKWLKIAGRVVIFVVIAIVFAAYIFPIFWMGVSSLKTKVQIFDPKPMLFFKPTLKNYRTFIGIEESGEVGAGRAGASTSFIAAMGRSILITASATLLSLILGTMAGYVLSRYKMAGKDDLMFFILSTRMLPPIVILVPMSLLFTNIGLKDTYIGFLLLYTMFNMAFSVWIMKSFFDDVPFSFEEAAMCDGYTRLRAFFKVVLPMVKSGLAATAIFCSILIWNEFLFAIVMGTRKWVFMPPTIFTMSYGTEGVIWGVLASSSLIYIVPVIVFVYLVRKSLLRGITFGVIRG
ncbi:MAG: carbohydrate ABC transporter permease [Spirochaetes bacterium]|nr:carbohydrate ABC transporter permease [Spirochaetota bacterium]